MKLLLIFLFIPSVALAGTITQETVNFCIDDAFERYPDPKPGWSTFAYCENDRLYMVVESKVKGKTKYTQLYLLNKNYHREETGLPCNFSVSNCDVARYK